MELPGRIKRFLGRSGFGNRRGIGGFRDRIGYLKTAFDEVGGNRTNTDAVLKTLRRLGSELIPVALPDRVPVSALTIIVSAEAATAFDDLTRSGKDALMVRQIENAWPNVFRAARFIPPVEYIRANRARHLLVQDMEQLMQTIDLSVAPSFGTILLISNLTGHPCVVVPNGFNDKGSPTSISFVGRLFGEARILAVARQYQESTGFHLSHPSLEE